MHCPLLYHVHGSQILCRCSRLCGEKVRDVCGIIECIVLKGIPFRFSETEGIAAITMLVSRYKIEVKEEPEFVGGTFEERYARVTAFCQSLSTV